MVVVAWAPFRHLQFVSEGHLFIVATEGTNYFQFVPPVFIVGNFIVILIPVDYC